MQYEVQLHVKYYVHFMHMWRLYQNICLWAHYRPIFILLNSLCIIFIYTLTSCWNRLGVFFISCIDMDFGGLKYIFYVFEIYLGNDLEICHANEIEMQYVPAGVSGTDDVDTFTSSSVCLVDGIKLKVMIWGFEIAWYLQ